MLIHMYHGELYFLPTNLGKRPKTLYFPTKMINLIEY